MARIRSIHPGFAKSADIAALSIPCQLHFALLWTYADDYGKGKDDVRLIKAECWPLQDAMTVKKVEALQAELARAGRIIRYTVDGKRYFQVVNWGKYQHPQKARDSEYPDPPPPVALPDSNSTPPVALPPVVGEGEGEGGEVGEGASGGAPDFAPFWQAYPPRDGKRLNKTKAEGYWRKMSLDDRAAALVGAGHLAVAIAAGGKFGPPDPDRWLRDRRWTEWQEPAKPNGTRPVAYSSPCGWNQ